MTIEISNPDLQRRLLRVVRVLDRADRWERLAFMENDEADRLLMEHDDAAACAGDTVALSQDDAPRPAGPRGEKNKSRYQLAPGHSQHLSDLLRNTAEVKAMTKISKLLNG